jgi:CRP-like cAMP-binding protein/small-conductance mechanosensitive channel
MAVPIVQWLPVHAELGWTLLGLICASVLLWKLAPEERRRIGFVGALSAAALVIWLGAALPASPPWILQTARAILELIGLLLAVVFVFQVILKRWRAPRILSDLIIGVGYVAILIALLTRVGVNLTGIIATSAVATAVIGFGMQDLLGNLAGGLVLEFERSIQEGDWIRTDQFWGQVRSVRMRHTALETPDGDTILAPNSVLMRSAVTVLGRTGGSGGGPIKHRKLVVFQLHHGYSPATVVEGVEQALGASAMEGIAENPRPRCIVVEYHPQYVEYGALVWLMRPGLEMADISGVRTRISFALTRIGAPLASIPYVVDQRTEAAPDLDAAAKERMDLLRRIEVVQCLNEEETRQLASHMRKVSFAPGEAILRQGDAGDSAYIVKSGRVRILLSNDSGLSEQVACLAPGDFFGEMSLLTGERRTATAMALDQVDCYHLAKADLDAVFAGRPDVAADIAGLLANRQAGLAAVREKLSDEAARQRELQNRSDLLSRIRRYFAISGS